MKKLCILIVLVLSSLSFAQAQGCSDAKASQFDFWIGEWEVSAGGNVVGTNKIEPILDGCVLQENWVGASGSKGTSLNHYNPKTGKWQQHWVWKNGTTLPLLVGEYKDGKMILQGKHKDKKGEVIERVTWFNNEDGTVRQFWQQSRDNGMTWTVAFDGHYKKK